MDGEEYVSQFVKSCERSFRKYMEKIDSPLDIVYIVERENLEDSVEAIRPELLDENGKLSDEHYEILANKICEYLSGTLQECYWAELFKLEVKK